MYIYTCSFLQFPPVKFSSVNNKSSIRLTGLERMINGFVAFANFCNVTRLYNILQRFQNISLFRIG